MIQFLKNATVNEAVEKRKNKKIYFFNPIFISSFRGKGLVEWLVHCAQITQVVGSNPEDLFSFFLSFEISNNSLPSS